MMIAKFKSITMPKKFIFIFFLILGIFNSCKEDTKDGSQDIKISGSGKEVVTLNWLGHWAGEGKKETLIHEIAREFSLLNQDINLALKFPHEVYTYKDESELFIIGYHEIVKMVQNDHWPWDVMLCDQERYVKAGELLKDPQWGKKYLVDFSKEPWFNSVHKKGLFDSGELLEKYGGIIPGPILEGIANILYISEDVEKLLGIKVKRHDMEFSDFLSYAQVVYNYNKTHDEKISFFSTQYSSGLASLLSQLVQSEYGKTTFTSKQESLSALRKVYEKLEQLSVYKPIEQYTTFPGMAYDAAQRVLKHDKFLFNLQPSWMYLLWNNTNPKGTNVMKPCEIPSMDGKKSPTYSGFYQVIFAVPQHSKNVEAAKRFIKFIASEQTAETWIKYAKSPTGLNSKISYSDFGQEEFELYYRHLQNKYGNNQKEVNLSKLMFNTNNNLNFNTEYILQGKMTASEAIRNLEKQVY